MKVNKMVSMDVDVVKFLKTVNASELINRLVREHMKDEDIMSMNIDELRAEKACQELERETKKKQQELRENARHK